MKAARHGGEGRASRGKAERKGGTRRVLLSLSLRKRREARTRKEGHRTRGERAALVASPPRDRASIARTYDRHGCESWPLWPWHWTCGRRTRDGTRGGRPAPAEGTAGVGSAAELRNERPGVETGGGGRPGRGGRARGQRRTDDII